MKIIAKFLTAAALAAVASSASAADLRPAYKAAPAPVPVAYNWSGFYAGIHGGYGWGDINANLAGFTGSREIDGFFGGGQIGWNWQAAGSPWVWGIEADISFGNIEDFGDDRGRWNVHDRSQYLRHGAAASAMPSIVRSGMSPAVSPGSTTRSTSRSPASARSTRRTRISDGRSAAVSNSRLPMPGP